MEQTAEDVEVSQITNSTEVGCRSPTIKLGAPSEEESGPLSRDELQALWESDPLTAVMVTITDVGGRQIQRVLITDGEADRYSP